MKRLRKQPGPATMLNESNSDDEKEKVKVMERKSEAELKRQPLQGQLMKFTNVVKVLYKRQYELRHL